MSRAYKIIASILVALLLSGCSLRTVDQLYALPKRSEGSNDLQSAIDRHMEDLSYCAPLSGENPQTVQAADLDGDGEEEYLLFAKGHSEKPLQILVFRLEGEGYVLSDTIENAGSAYDIVEYAQIDDQPGRELVVGCQVSDQVTRSVSVYRFTDGKAQQLLNTNYAKFLSFDSDHDGRSELMVLGPGQTPDSVGIAVLYSYGSDGMERSNEAAMSASVDRMKRIVTGRLEDGAPAVYVASTVGETAIITDVLAVVDGYLKNVSLSNESGTSVQTLRNYYVYADDIDEDGVVELPDLITMVCPGDIQIAEQQYLIRWYSMDGSGKETDKDHTYHNFRDGWYVSLGSDWAERVAVVQMEEVYEFYVWDEDFLSAQRLFTIAPFTGKDREEDSAKDNRFVLYEAEDTIYSAYLEVASAGYGITQDSLIRSFHLIEQDRKSGET